MSTISVNKTALQNIRQFHFLEPDFRRNWPIEVAKIATLYEFDENE
jgi:hypothetical protein